MGQNGGLYYKGLPLDSRIIGADGDDGTKLRVNSHDVLERALAQYGLNGSVGESIHELVSRGEISMHIRVPNPIKPNLTERERLVLEATATVLVQRGGYFHGHVNEVSELVGMPNRKTRDVIATLSSKFNARNIEEAVVKAVVWGATDPKELFGDQIPKPLIAVANLWLHTRLKGAMGTAPSYGENLTDAEKDIALELIRRTGLNGGLYWEWWQDVAGVTGKSYNAVAHIIRHMRQRFGTDKVGVILYGVGKHLKRPVVVKLPPRVDINIAEVERTIMLETARILLPAGGIYHNHLKDISNRVHYAVGTLRNVNREVIRKTKTENTGQAVASLIAHGVIPLYQLNLDVKTTPALEAIVTAMGRADYKV